MNMVSIKEFTSLHITTIKSLLKVGKANKELAIISHIIM